LEEKMNGNRKQLGLAAWVVLLAAGAWIGSLSVRAEEHDGHEACGTEGCGHEEHGGKKEPGGHAEHGDHGHEGHGGEKEEAGEGAGHGHGHGEEEGHIELSAEMMKQLGVTVLEAGPAKLNVSVTLTGKVVAQEDRVAHVTPRFSGVIREVRKRLGDPVARGETVAVVENNQTLQPFEVKSQIPGQVVRRHATIGESVTDASTLFEVADYSELFVDFFVFPSDFAKVRVGQRVQIRFQDERVVESVITFLSPVTDPETQSRFVRAVLPNTAAAFQAGMFVSGDLVLEETTVEVAVANTALRTSEGKPVVFVEEEPGHFEARPVLTGRKDKDSAEILKGLEAGTRYAAGNTFILQAELEKGEAAHEH
jgi:cobalt-zinc-cadmium efflux system membrane fusion protein